MKKIFKPSNIIFIVLLFFIVYKPSRVWIIKLFSTSPSVQSVNSINKIEDYSWQLKGLNTNNFNMKDSENKVIFINFWATWCPPCIAEMQSIQDFYNDYKNKVTFIFITGDSWNEINEFYKENNYNLPVYHPITNYPKGLPQPSSIPRTFIIDKKGFIRVDKSGSANWNSSEFRKEIDTMLKD